MRGAGRSVAQADIPTVAPGVDVLAGIAELRVRIRGYDYHRDGFGDSWTDDMRLRFANDPANLIVVEGQANQDKGDQEPAAWMPPNAAFRCKYAMQFIAVLRGYALPVDAPSATVLRNAAATCPTS
jgi:hypothetical protein